MSTYHQVADHDLDDLGPETNATLEELLEEPDEKVAQGSADQGTIRGHLGHARGEVVAMFVAVLGQPRCEEFLSSGEGTGSEHLGAQRVRLELLDVGLKQLLAKPNFKPTTNLWWLFFLLHSPSLGLRAQDKKNIPPDSPWYRPWPFLLSMPCRESRRGDAFHWYREEERRPRRPFE